MREKSIWTGRVVAHRGYASAHMENTLAAFEAAARAGCRYVECDLQLTADRVPVLLHDVSLARTFSDDRSVFDLSSEELGTVRPGLHAAGPPTLAAFLDWLDAEPEVEAFVEIKEGSIARFGREVVAREVIAAVSAGRSDASTHGSDAANLHVPVAGRLIIISFDREILSPFREAGYPVGWILREKTNDSLAAATALAPAWLFYDIKKLGDQDIEPGVWRWCLYEITSAATVARFRKRDDVYFETMQVETLRDELRGWDGGA